MRLEIDWLKENHQMIHFFGLGFIQLKIDPYTRLHFYTTKFSPIVADDSAHNHRYDFISHILFGELKQYLYLFKEDPLGQYVLEQEACQEGAEPSPTKRTGDLIEQSAKSYGPGGSYTLLSSEFHKVEARQDTITYLLRGHQTKTLADVIRHKDSEKVCPFSKKISETDLWLIVDEMIKNRNIQLA
jgi:hypothetical protein